MLQDRSKHKQTGKLFFARKHDYITKSFVPDLDLDININSITEVTENQESSSLRQHAVFLLKETHDIWFGFSEAVITSKPVVEL